MSVERIRALNDAFRTTFSGGKVMMTAGVDALSNVLKGLLIAKVQAYDGFTADNDPHGEHDFGALDFLGKKFFWKIDYYDAAIEFGSEDPADPSKTIRVLTIMLAEEY